MDYSTIKFPIEGNVQDYVHFRDSERNYAFTFASPFQYTYPEGLKAKKAFIVGRIDPFDRKQKGADEIYFHYVALPEKKPYPEKKANANVHTVQLFSGTDKLIGSIEVLSQKGAFRRLNGDYVSVVRDIENKPIGFCAFDSAAKSKSVFLAKDDFDHFYEKMGPEILKEWENAGVIRRIFTYDIVKVEASSRERLESIFSPSKKSEMSNQRLHMIQKPESNDEMEICLAAIFAYFWQTYIELPLFTN